MLKVSGMATCYKQHRAVLMRRQCRCCWRLERNTAEGIAKTKIFLVLQKVGNEPFDFLEMFRAAKFEDSSREQRLTQTPKRTVAKHMDLTGVRKEEFLKGLLEDNYCEAAIQEKADCYWT